MIADLAFEVGDGRFACLIGPSGCGKTTTLRVILGLDRDVRGLSGCRPAPTGSASSSRSRVCFPGAPSRRTSAWRCRARETRDLESLFDVLGLADLKSHYPAELSLGLARRVALARAFAVEPGLLVLDEPFASLDGATAERMRRLLVTVWEARPTTALMVTHNLSEAVALADDVIVLSGRPARVLGVHRSPWPGPSGHRPLSRSWSRRSSSGSPCPARLRGDRAGRHPSARPMTVAAASASSR